LKFFLGQNGLRGYVDRIVQIAEQQALDRPSSGRTGGSTTITRTAINTTGSNFNYGSSVYGQGGATGASALGSFVSQSLRPSSTGYETVSSSVRSTVRDSNFSDNDLRSARDY